MSSSHWEDFYATHLPPNCFEDNRSLLKEFCDRHFKLKSNIVLITVIDLDRAGSIEKGSRIKGGGLGGMVPYGRLMGLNG